MNAENGVWATGRFHLFAYGTLKGGASAGELLEGCERVGPAAVTGTLYDIDGAYPALVLAGNGVVRGEVWRCPVDRLRALDEYEGVPEGLFRRVALRVGALACWTYVAGPALVRRLTRSRRIPSGCWTPAEEPRR